MNILPGGYVSSALKWINSKGAVSKTLIESELLAASLWHVNESTSNLLCKTDMDRDVLNDCRLPFPYMALEWDNGWADYSLEYEKKIMYAVDAKHTEQPFAINFTTKGEVIYHKPNHRDGFYFQTINQMDRHSRWLHWPIAFFVPYSEFEDMGKFLNEKDFGGFTFGVTDDRIRRVFAGRASDMSFLKDNLNGFMHHAMLDFQRFSKFIAALSCSAVETEEVDPNKNLSRLKRSRLKYELNKYRTIVIDAPSRRSTSETDGDGADISPHWRRGHIRRQPTKEGIKNVWIRPTIVCRNKVVKPLPLPKSKVISQNQIRAL